MLVRCTKRHHCLLLLLILAAVEASITPRAAGSPAKVAQGSAATLRGGSPSPTLVTAAAWPSTTPSTKDSTPASRALADDKADEEIGSDALSVLLPELIEQYIVSAVAVLMIVKATNDNIHACFEAMPGNTCLFLTFMLGVFCWTVLSSFWWFDESDFLDLGVWTALSGLYSSIILLMTPIILLVPDQKKSRELSTNKVGEAWWSCLRDMNDRAKFWMALIYVLIFAFQIASSVHVYHLAEVKGAKLQAQGYVSSASEGGFSLGNGALMTTLLYLILAWCNLIVVYEGVLAEPGHTFMDDFPMHILERACPFMSKHVHTARRTRDQLQTTLNGAVDMAERQLNDLDKLTENEITGQLKTLQQCVTDVAKSTKEIHGNVHLRAQGIKDSAKSFCDTVDQRLFRLHYCLYALYSVVALSVAICMMFQVLPKIFGGLGLVILVILGSCILLPFGWLAWRMLFGFGHRASDQGQQFSSPPQDPTPSVPPPQQKWRAKPAAAGQRYYKQPMDDSEFSEQEAVTADLEIEAIKCGDRWLLVENCGYLRLTDIRDGSILYEFLGPSTTDDSEEADTEDSDSDIL